MSNGYPPQNQWQQQPQQQQQPYQQGGAQPPPPMGLQQPNYNSPVLPPPPPAAQQQQWQQQQPQTGGYAPQQQPQPSGYPPLNQPAHGWAQPQQGPAPMPTQNKGLAPPPPATQAQPPSQYATAPPPAFAQPAPPATVSPTTAAPHHHQGYPPPPSQQQPRQQQQPQQQPQNTLHFDPAAASQQQQYQMPQPQQQSQPLAPPPPPPQQYQQQNPQQLSGQATPPTMGAASGGNTPPPNSIQSQQQQPGGPPLPPPMMGQGGGVDPLAQRSTSTGGTPPNQRQQQRQTAMGPNGQNPSFSNTSFNTNSQPGSPAQPPPSTQQQQQQQQAPSSSSAAAANNRDAKKARLRPQGTNRIDSANVPTPCKDIAQEAQTGGRITHYTAKTGCPLALSNFTAVDDGNCSAKYIRPTLHAVPHQESFLSDSGLTWGALLSPLFGELEIGEERVPSVRGRKPVRCARCRAYVNCHCQFADLGKRWMCNFCGMPNDVDAEYFSNLDAGGRRRDANEKPELCRGSVEYDVEDFEEYALRNERGEIVAKPRQSGGATADTGRPLKHLFAIDVSKAAKGLLPSLVASIRATLQQMATRYPMCDVSFITFAETLHFYNFQNPSMPQYVVADVDSPFVPLPFSHLCWINLGTSLDVVESFLDRVEAICEATEENGCALGAAVHVASLILSESGGKVIVASTNACTCGIGALTKREHVKMYGSDTEKTLYKPIDGFWPTTAVACAKRQVSFDLLLFANEYCELVTIGQLCHLTNGNQTLLHNYNPATEVHRVENALALSCLQEAGYGGMLRVRCSSGIRLTGYHGHYLQQNDQDMDLAAVHSSSTFLADFGHEAKIDPKSYGYVQCALLYTTRSGRRCVRVHTLRMAVANSYSSLFRHADLEAHTHALIFHAVKNAVNKGLVQSREITNQRLIDMLVAYRKHCSSSTHTGQLLLPEQLKLMPLYCLCAQKSDALLPGTTVRLDDRIQAMFTLLSVPQNKLLYYLYPRLYSVISIVTVAPQAGTPKIEGTEFPVIMPPLTQLSYDAVLIHGVYLLHDQQAQLAFLWIGSQVAAKYAQPLFGTDDASTVDLSTMDQWNDRLRRVVQMLTREGARLVIAHEKKDSLEDAFFRNLLEDESVPGVQSYSDFLCTLHKKINSKLA